MAGDVPPDPGESETALKCPFSNPGASFWRTTGQKALLTAHSHWRGLRRKGKRRRALDPEETPSEKLFAISEEAELHYARTSKGWLLYELPAHEATLLSPSLKSSSCTTA